MDNTAPNPRSPVPSSPLPRFEWHPPSDDCPRMSWCDWLSMLSDQLAVDYPGETGLFVSSIIGAMVCQARELSAYSPSQQEELAQSEADRAAAYLQALLHAAEQPGGWVIIQPGPEDSDATGGWGGHEAQPDIDPQDEGTYRGYFPVDPESDTYLN